MTHLTSSQRNELIPACVEAADLFQHRLLEDGAKATNVNERHQQQMMMRKAENLCLDCPLMVNCLYRAVVEHDVNGVCAATTAQQRQQMRHLLGIQVAPEGLDTFAGVTSGHQVDHQEVLRLRAANPSEPLEAIAQRLGCSLSTVKRHLRKARRGETIRQPMRNPGPKPSIEAVLAAHHEVSQHGSTQTMRKAA